VRQRATHTRKQTGPCLLANAAGRPVRDTRLAWHIGPRPLFNLLLTFVLAILFTACATTQPRQGTVSTQSDTLASSDSVVYVPGGTVDSDSGLGDGGGLLIGDQPDSSSVYTPMPGDIVLSAGPTATKSAASPFANTQPGSGDYTPVTNDSSSATANLIQLDGPPVMRGFIQPSPISDSLFAADSLALDSTALDSSLFAADSTAIDSLAEADTNDSDLDTTITYSAENIYFRVPDRTTILTGNASVDYKGMILRAHRIEVDWNNDLMTATPTLDTLYTDSTETEIDSLIVVGQPTFDDGGDKLEGDLLKVNIKTRAGYVEGGSTQYGIGVYHGKQIQKVSDEVLFVKDGYFTTSLDDPPDYKFTSNEMKMIVGDKVVGKPVVLRFGEVPVFAMPFAVFSIQRGRRSGILIPTYGQGGTQGRSLTGLGYYWAASDYWDLESRMSFYEKTGLMLSSNFIYRDRYNFNGAIGGSIDNRNVGPRGWDLRVLHSQQFGRNTRLKVDGKFVSSGGYYDSYSNNVNQRINQRMNSNATFSHNWPERGSSFSLNLKHEQDLEDKTNSQTLPNMSYRHGLIRFFPTEQQKKSDDKTLLYEPPQPRLAPGERVEQRDSDDEEKWYNNLTMSYNNRMQQERSEDLVSDGAGGTELEETWRSGLEHNISFKAPQKVMRYLNLNPSISYNEDWMLERRNWYIDDNGLSQSIQERGFFQRRTFNASLNTTTKLYGFFPMNRWSIQTFRHVLTPTVGMSYRPDFSDPEFDYYQRLERTLEVQEIDPTTLDTLYSDVTYSDERDRYYGGILGGTSRGKRLSANFSLNNLFQMKRVKLDDEGEEIESKYDLFSYNVSTSYNFAADSLNFSDLSASFRASPITGKTKLGPLDQLNLDIQTQHSFYQYDVVNNRRSKDLYWDRDDFTGLNFLRLTSFSTSSNFAITGSSPFTARKPQAEAPPDTTTQRPDDDIRQQINERFSDPSERFNGTGGSPWRVNGSIRYRLSMVNPMEPRETLFVTASLSLKLTERWSFQYSTSLDLINKDIANSNLSVKRDLESWEGTFRWSPQGINQGFYLRIGIKAPMLRDVQLEQRRRSTGFGGF
jgi:LptD protein